MMRILLLLATFILMSCSNARKDERTIDFTKDQDFRIVNVFNESKYQDLSSRLPKQIEPDVELQENYVHYSYLSLRPNKTYTFLLGNQFMHGIYEMLNPDEILLKSNDFGSIPLKIINEKNKAIQVYGDFKNYKSDFMLELEGNTNYYLNFKTDFEVLSKENDIRSVAFNEWRFRSNVPENDAAIKNRLMQNLKFMAAYMRVHLYGNFDQINTGGIHSPFLHAKNSLVLYEWLHVSYFWKNIFYDVKDAEKAYKILKRTFNETESPPYIDNWLAYNEACLQEIIKTIEKMD